MAQLKPYRIVVRGTNSEGKRIRKLHRTWQPNAAAVKQELAVIQNKLAETFGLEEVYCTVTRPPKSWCEQYGYPRDVQ